MAQIAIIFSQLVQAPAVIIRDVVLPVCRATRNRIVDQFMTTVGPLALVLINGIKRTTTTVCLMGRTRFPELDKYDALAALAVLCMSLMLVFIVAATFFGRNNAVVAMTTLAMAATVILFLSPGCLN